jgi:hypothetical protein
MKNSVIFVAILFTGMALINSCQQKATEETLESEWIGSEEQEIINNIEFQFQGFSRTMMEVSHRYQELYWAGQDANWGYASYQHEHILEALEQGFMRRPEHEESAQSFLNVALPNIEKAIKEEDQQVFSEAFTNLTSTCYTCHQMEDVAFMTITEPKTRQGIVYY